MNRKKNRIKKERKKRKKNPEESNQIVWLSAELTWNQYTARPFGGHLNMSTRAHIRIRVTTNRIQKPNVKRLARTPSRQWLGGSIHTQFSSTWNIIPILNIIEMCVVVFLSSHCVLNVSVLKKKKEVQTILCVMLLCAEPNMLDLQKKTRFYQFYDPLFRSQMHE